MYTELRNAMARHDAAWQATKHLPLAGISGPVAEANHHLDELIKKVDQALIAAGKLNRGETIGNDERLRRLEGL